MIWDNMTFMWRHRNDSLVFDTSPIIVGSVLTPDVIIFSTAHPMLVHTTRQSAQMVHVYMCHGLFPIMGKRVFVNIVK